jgi:hypothetical protein
MSVLQIPNELTELEQARLLVYSKTDAIDHGAKGRREAAWPSWRPRRWWAAWPTGPSRSTAGTAT